jgi:UDP-glucose 4-epimerase
MRIALTGGSGLVGRAIMREALAQGHTIVSIDRVGLETKSADGISVTADVTDYGALLDAMTGCDALIHMAAIPKPFRDPDHIVHNNNVVGSYNALRAAAEHGITRVCQASSVNAIGLSYSRAPRFDYFPLDEAHPNHAEDAYALSKWICEQQADSLVRRYEDMRIASLRLHWVVPQREIARAAAGSDQARRDLWGYVDIDAVARAALLSLEPRFTGHEAFYIVAPDTCSDLSSMELAREHYPAVPVTGDLSGHRSFFSSAKAERLLGWTHDPAGPEPA